MIFSELLSPMHFTYLFSSLRFFALSSSSLLTACLIAKLFQAIRRSNKLKHIPTIGSSGIFTSYLDAFRYTNHGHEIVQKGYDNYYGSAFKIPVMERWLVVVTGPGMIDDIRRASDEHMSFDDAIAEIFQIDYTMGPPLHYDPYHNSIIQTSLTRNIASRFDDIHEEIECAFNENVSLKENEWSTVPALSTAMTIVCRASNRLFLGLPLCRDKSFLNLNYQFAFDVVRRGQLINLFPAMLKPIAGRLLSRVRQNIDRAISHVGPMIRYQLEQEELHEYNWASRPNNFLSWLLDEAKPHNRTVEDMALRVLSVNFAAIHTSSQAFTHALYDLATHPECVAPLREEIETIIEEEGWSKAAIGKMNKLDSFIKESQRLAVSTIQMHRKIVKDFTFSNGVFVPAGTHIAVATRSTHLDKRNHKNPEQFEAFRFLDKRGEKGESMKHQFVSLSPDYLLFGSGRHACPGRFFASNMLKAMLAHVLINYDVKLPNDGPRPENIWYQGQVFPNAAANVLFRKRSVLTGNVKGG